VIKIPKILNSASFAAVLLVLAAHALFSEGSYVHAQDHTMEAVELSEMKYDKKVTKLVNENLEAEKHTSETVNIINDIPKAEVMDKYLEELNGKKTGPRIRDAVDRIFEIDIDYVSKNNYGNTLSSYEKSIMQDVRASFQLDPESEMRDGQIMELKKNQVMDRVVRQRGDVDGAEARVIINQIFGINLNGISGLEGAQLGIFSKGQWIIKSENDLFIISSSTDDVELYVYATDYYEEKFGTYELPESLKRELERLEFVYDADKKQYTWINPTGESAPDVFKTEAIGYMMAAIIRANQ
jgi:hypothetical protein